MQSKRYTFTIHALVWILLVIIPYVSTDQVFTLLDPASDFKYLMLCMGLSAILLITFYFNYLILIPRFLYAKRYLSYFIYLFLAIILVFALSGAIFFFSDFNPQSAANINPAIEKIIPVVIINAVSLWLLAILTSILWTIYNRLKQTESERLSAQIASLKSQINPHFLFNTLNNIYATAINTAPVAAEMVAKLSEMMRYSMRDTQRDFIDLEDEITYIDNFVELQKMRLEKKVRLEYTNLAMVPDLQIAPMLVVPFIENAFKHGVNSEEESYIKIEIMIEQSDFLLRVTNNKVSIQHDIAERSGLGIANTSHRLKLIYPSKHMLVINETATQFFVSLHINLQ